MKVLKTYCRKAFKKIRISKKRKIKPLNPELSKMIDERNTLMTAKPENQEEIDKLNGNICEIEASENRDKIMKNFKSFGDTPEKINQQQMWKLNRKLWPKCGGVLPVAKKNHKGKLVSNPKAIKKLLAREYKERLRKRPVRQDFIEMRNRRKKIFKMKMKFAGNRSSPDWTMRDLEAALKNLKKKNPETLKGISMRYSSLMSLGRI